MRITSSSKRLIPFIISLAVFMEMVDTTIINTAIPSISRSLQVNPIDLKIALISYLLSLAIFIPISGWVADKFGIKRVFIGAIAIFTLSSIWCGFSQNLIELVIARTVQGLGGALTVPVGRLIILRTVAKNERITVMNRVMMVASIGPMLGPPLGGIITHYLSWHWIFWVNVPVGLLTILLAVTWLVAAAPIKVPPLDKLGFVLFGLSLAGITFGLSAFSESNIGIYYSLGIMALSLAILGLYYRYSLGQPNPIVRIELFKLRTFRIATLGNLLVRACFGGMPFLLPLSMQLGLGYSAQLAGLLMAPIAMGVFFTKLFSQSILNRFGFKRVLIFNTLLISLSVLSFMLLKQGISLYLIAMLVFIFGVFMSMQFSCMNPLAYAEVDGSILNNATSIVSTNQQLAQSFGVAISACLLRYFSHSNTQAGLRLPVFHHTFLILGFFTAFTAFIFFGLRQQDGQDLLKK